MPCPAFLRGLFVDLLTTLCYGKLMLKMRETLNLDRKEHLSRPGSPRIEHFLAATALVDLGPDVISDQVEGGATTPVTPSELTDSYIRTHPTELEYIVRLLDASKTAKKNMKGKKGKARRRYQKESAITVLHADELIAHLFGIRATDDYGNITIELLKWRANLRDGEAHARIKAHHLDGNDNSNATYTPEHGDGECEPVLDARQLAAGEGRDS